jgi:glycosyltransferase involved in cell wall biosynthesis
LGSRVLNVANRVAAVSEFVAGHLHRLGRDDVTVIYNGANEQTFAPRDRAQSRAALSLPRERPVIAFAGHILAEKGVFDLIDATAELRDLDPLLALAGTGERVADARKRAEARGVDARFMGRLDHDSLSTLLGACDVFALPSYAEGLPTVLCEAMMAGRAVVATRVGGIPEIVRDGVTGFVVEPGDRAGLGRALRAILEDDERRKMFAAEAHDFALRRLSWRANAARYEELYGNAMVAESAGMVAGAAAPLVESVPPSATP